jgi:hypothetical protein
MQAMRRRSTVVGLSALLLLVALFLLNWKAVRLSYYKWQLRSAEESMAAKDGLGHFVSMVAGAGDAQARASRAKKVLLDMHYLRELELPFPAGSDWPGLLARVRGRFPEGLWELSLDSSRSMTHLTAPTNQIEGWRKCVAEFTVH